MQSKTPTPGSMTSTYSISSINSRERSSTKSKQYTKMNEKNYLSLIATMKQDDTNDDQNNPDITLQSEADISKAGADSMKTEDEIKNDLLFRPKTSEK